MMNLLPSTLLLVKGWMLKFINVRHMILLITLLFKILICIWFINNWFLKNFNIESRNIWLFLYILVMTLEITVYCCRRKTLKLQSKNLFFFVNFYYRLFHIIFILNKFIKIIITYCNWFNFLFLLIFLLLFLVF